MFGTGITFWRFPEEEENFLSFLDRSGTVVAVPRGDVAKKSQLKPQPFRKLIQKGYTDILIGLPEQMDKLPVKKYRDKDGTHYAVLAHEAPALSYRRGMWRKKNKLGSSSISGAWTIYPENKNFKSTAQPKTFVAWGKKVTRWLRAATPQWHAYKTYRITPGVAQAIKKTGLQIVP